jgi:DNA repair exonuclease SbcCD ATPase subunit
MTGGVRINRLFVDAFRGISNPIDFDFSAPLTLVYAPNGTGKTTLCEAAEWLLTGQVDRLRDKGQFDAAVLQSRFNPDRPNPVADAEIVVGDKPHRLKREAKASQQGAQLDGTEVGPTELLAMLAPSAAAEESNHIRANSLRQSWLRGTRILTSEALAALVDSDEGTIDRRTQVFADIFGIRHLLEAEKQLEIFARDMGGHERRLAQDVGAIQSELDRLKQELEAAPSLGPDTVDTLLSSAGKLIGLTLPDERNGGGTVPDRLQQASAEIGRREHRLAAQAEAIEAAAAEWDIRSEAERRVKDLERTEAEQAPLLETQMANEKLASARLAELSARRETIALRARSLAAGQDSVVQHISDLIAAANDIPSSFGFPLTLGSIPTAVPETRMTEDGIELMRAELRDVLDEIRSAGERAERLSSLQTERERIAPLLLTEEALGALRQRVNELEAAASDAANRLSAIAGPLATLQSAGRELFAHEHSHSDDECPLCGHEWPSASALRNAVQKTLASVPEVERSAQQALSAANEAARSAKQQLRNAVTLSDQGRILNAEISKIQRETDVLRDRLNRLNVPPQDPIGSINALFARLATATAFLSLTSEFDRLKFALPDLPDSILPTDVSLTELADQVATELTRLKTSADLQLAELAQQHDKGVEERDKLRNEIAVLTESLTGTREELAGLRRQLARLKQLWAAAAPDLEWSDASLAKVRADVTERQTHTQQAASQVAAATKAWESETRRMRFEELAQKLRPLQAKLETVRARIGGAKAASRTFHDGYNEITQRQMNDLIRAVNPLFARMHGNQVVDAILPGKKVEPLRWAASAGDEQLDPSRDFSQGQRQDLALAFFLARARSLGGTFFLDEPITHLDDLNRVGLLDIFRATVMESSLTMNMVITTASKTLARHLVEKFSSIRTVHTSAGETRPLRVIELDGNGRIGVQMSTIYPASIQK